MKNRIWIITLLLIAAIALNACNLPLGQDAGNTQDIEMSVETIVAQTLAAQSGIGPSGGTATNTAEAPASATDTPMPTNTPMPTLTPFPTYTSMPTATVIPCLRAAFISETIPDGTDYAPGATFTKTWTLRNDGSCTWNSGYRLVFQSGNSMGGAASVALPSVVAPGQTVTVSTSLTAPATAGTYRGDYMLQNDSGTRFGLGANNNTFWVSIDVVSVAWAVTGATVTAEHTNIESSCAAPGPTFRFNAAISANGPGTITYRWEFSDGTILPYQSLVFSSAGTQNVTYERSMTTDGTYWVRIYNDVPNHQAFAQLTFTLHCTP